MEKTFGPAWQIDPKHQPHGTWREQKAADYMGLKVSTLRQWRFLSKGPVYLKIGRSVRYRQEDLDAFLQQAAVQPAGN